MIAYGRGGWESGGDPSRETHAGAAFAQGEKQIARPKNGLVMTMQEGANGLVQACANRRRAVIQFYFKGCFKGLIKGSFKGWVNGDTGRPSRQGWARRTNQGAQGRCRRVNSKESDRGAHPLYNKRSNCTERATCQKRFSAWDNANRNAAGQLAWEGYAGFLLGAKP